jgi:hypothetical protein
VGGNVREGPGAELDGEALGGGGEAPRLPLAACVVEDAVPDCAAVRGVVHVQRGDDARPDEKPGAQRQPHGAKCPMVLL